MKTKRLFCFLMALTMVISCFLVACKGDDGEKKTAGQIEAPTDTVDTSKVYDAPVKDLGGHEFMIYSKGSAGSTTVTRSMTRFIHATFRLKTSTTARLIGLLQAPPI